MNQDQFSRKKLIIFDLDGTLTRSKSPIDSEMAALLVDLLARKKVAVISGGGYAQFETQFIKMIPSSGGVLSGLFLLPTSGTRMYSWKDAWVEQYAENLTVKEKEKIMTALGKALKETGYQKPTAVYGPLVEDRGSQITFSALGQRAPIELKYAWDPTRQKRELLASSIHRQIPEFDARVGGTTSVDITKRGVNKGYGIRKLEDYLKMQPDDITFIGDALFYGGNDYPAKATGVDCLSVAGPEETRKLIRTWLS